jgi:tripeptide aminopeptidase
LSPIREQIVINNERLTSILVNLCRIPSPSGKEYRIVEYIRNYAAEFGIKVKEDKAGTKLDSSCGNLTIELPGDERERLFLSSHMDTVKVPDVEEISVIRTKDKLQTDGSSILGGDDKAGIAAALEILTLSMENPGENRPLELIFTIKEEQGALGSGFFDPTGIKAVTGFNLDGETPPYTVICKAPYKTRYKCVIKGKAAHAAVNPEDGINAVQIAGKIVSALPSGKLDEISTANISKISGGGPTNVVPDNAVIEGEVRSFEKGTLDVLKKEIEQICSKETLKTEGSAEVYWEDLYDGYVIDPEEKSSQLFIKACRAMGKKPVFLSSPGGGDSNQFNNKGMRNLVFGLGMHNIHSTDEYLELTEYFEAATLLKNIVFQC